MVLQPGHPPAAGNPSAHRWAHHVRAAPAGPHAARRVRRRIGQLIVLALVAVLAAPAISGEPSPAPCAAMLRTAAGWQEELTFTIKWKFVSAGTAVIRLIPTRSEGGAPRFRIQMTARSNSFIDTFYRVRDSAESLVEADFRRSLYFAKNLREGSFAREEILEYDILGSKGFFFRDGKLNNTLRLPEEYQDSLSGLYRFRLTPTEPGKNVMMYATDGRRLMRIRAEVLAREQLTVPAGTFNCLKVELFPETLEGPFIRKKHGRIFLWFSDDECRLPVKISTEVIIGAIETVLEKVDYRALTP